MLPSGPARDAGFTVAPADRNPRAPAPDPPRVAAGVGLSALLDAQDIAALRETLLGIVLVAVGLGIVVRGFLLRGRTVR